MTVLDCLQWGLSTGGVLALFLLFPMVVGEALRAVDDDQGDDSDQNGGTQ